MAEPHDRCTLDGCTLGREHTSEHLGPRCPACNARSVWTGTGWYCRARNRSCLHEGLIPVPAEPARQPMPAAAPLAAEAASVDQLLLDLQAMASEEDERACSAQRRAADLRAMIREINAWRTKTSPSSTVATNGRRGFQP